MTELEQLVCRQHHLQAAQEALVPFFNYFVSYNIDNFPFLEHRNI